MLSFNLCLKLSYYISLTQEIPPNGHIICVENSFKDYQKKNLLLNTNPFQVLKL